jgi:hypothetical protein
MKNNLLKQSLVITLLSTVLLALFQILAAPALADGPVINEEAWEGHIWIKDRKDPPTKTFNAPAQATAVEILADWGWTGEENLVQTNEKHAVRLPNGQVIRCDDYGDNVGGWFRCGSTKFEWDDDLDIAVVFTGDDSSPGSHYFRVIVRWYGSEPPSSELQVTVDCKGAHFTGEASHPMDLMYQVSDGQHASVRVEDEFSESIEWNPQIDGSCGPHNVSAEAELVFEGRTVTSDQASDQLNCDSVVVVQQCTLTSSSDGRGNTLVNLGAIDEDGNSIPIEAWKSESSFDSDQVSANSPNLLPVKIRFPKTAGRHWVQFEVSAGGTWLGGQACRIEHDVYNHTTGQYQDFIGAVPFGTFIPYLEPGKEYFDGPRSLMFNVEFITETGQGDVIFRFNGQEVSDITTSIFNADTFRQVRSRDGRAVTSFDNGMTKLIAYRYGAEQARIFQAITPGSRRWIHPLDQPFEHKYDFELALHGPADTTDLLVYGDKFSHIRYNENGIAVVALTFTEPSLVAIYPIAEDGTNEVEWTMVEAVSYPISTTETVHYAFDETGLYHYRLADASGQVVAGPSASSHIEFNAKPGMIYYAQLAYPATSLFVGLYDDMKFQHPDYWTMPIDARFEHDFEFHLDYHRLDDPDLGNGHVRGDVVVDALYLTNGTTSVAQQFPYGRHDGGLPGVTIVGIPNVSMVAFCQRPGMHEVVYWGGWENESYYLPDRSWIFDEELYNEWTEDQRGDCIDAAQRVNMELARQGLRTDHTYRHHGELSQGYQMAQQHIWSPYNLVGMRPPHIGKFLKPGMVLSYYEDPADTLFWAWDLENGGLVDGIGEVELRQYVNSLGVVMYGDQTGIHSSGKL